jgi:hypothetical protein
LTAQELSLLTHPDFVNHVALVAAIGKRQEQIVGDGRYVRMANSREAELFWRLGQTGWSKSVDFSLNP